MCIIHVRIIHTIDRIVIGIITIIMIGGIMVLHGIGVFITIIMGITGIIMDIRIIITRHIIMVITEDETMVM